jgi:hypothetical protein
VRKKIATLEVYLDDEIMSSGCGTHWRGDLRPGGEMEAKDNKWQIILNPKGEIDVKDANRTRKLPQDTSLLTTFAHELGHFAAQVMRTPAAMEDVKGMAKAEIIVREIATEFEQQTGLPAELLGMSEENAWHKFPPAIRAKYRAESEAWDIGRMIHPGLNEGEAEKALDTYREGLRAIADGRVRDWKSEEEEAEELKEAA